MSKWQAIKGVISTFLSMTREDWNEMDHKLLRIATGAVAFILMMLFWFYFFRNIAPWPF